MAASFNFAAAGAATAFKSAGSGVESDGFASTTDNVKSSGPALMRSPCFTSDSVFGVSTTSLIEVPLVLP